MLLPKNPRIELPPLEYKILCKVVLARDKFACRLCRRREGLHVHHVVFRSQQGDDASYNLLSLCSMKCHDAVHRGDLVILPLKDGDPIDANKGVKWLFKNGWHP